MLYTRKIDFLFILLTFFSSISLAQNISFSARADARQVPLGGYVEVSFTLKNADLSNPQLPDFRNFNILSGPNQGSSINIINGVKTVEETISFTLQTKTLGTFTLAPAKVNIKGKTYSTETIQIEVVKSNMSAKNNQKGAFLKLESDIKESYIGGQIVLDLKLYANTEIRPMEFLQLPNLDAFFHKDIENLTIPPIKEVIKGVQFQTQILKRVILFPQKEGSFTITPCSISAMTGEMFDASMVSLQSNELIINVKARPSETPALFNGAVGVLELESTISQNQATTDDALSMQVTVTGKGDPNLVFAPKFKLSDSIELYEPKLISETDSGQNGDNFSFSKTFEYVLVPKFAGAYAIKPALTYFDTETNQYETISTSAHNLVITQGVGKKDNNPNPTTPIISPTSKVSIFNIVALIGILLALFGGFFWWKRKGKNQTIEPNLTPIITSENTIISKVENIVNQPVINKINDLKAAEIALEYNDLNSFYKHVGKAVVNQIAAYFSESENTNSRDILLAKLDNSPKSTLSEEARELLAVCDKMRFGGGQNELSPSEILEITKIWCNRF
jgi:hypothetical protein